MSFPLDRSLLVVNQTDLDKSLDQETATAEMDPRPTMQPWLLPALAALSMVIFLVVSFSLHHKRFVRQQRRLSQYYTLRYHRVAGPILNYSPCDLDAASTDKDQEQPHKLTRLTRSLSLKFKLNRYNTWSPQVFKNRLSGHFRANRRSESGRDEVDPGVFAQLQSLDGGSHRVISRHESLLPGHFSLTDSELLSLADLSGLTRSYSSRSRAVGVTTLSGTLAVAKYKGESAMLSSGVDSKPSHRVDGESSHRVDGEPSYRVDGESSHRVDNEPSRRASATKNTTLNAFHHRPKGTTYDADCSDGFHASRSRSQPSSRLSRYLEDDSFNLLEHVTGYNHTEGKNCTSSRGTSHAGSDDVFTTSAHVDCDDSYPDVLPPSSGYNPHRTAPGTSLRLARATELGSSSSEPTSSASVPPDASMLL